MSEQKKQQFSCVILAAGKGTRMKSAMPKVMHKLAGMPLIAHVVRAAAVLSPEKTVVVVAPHMDTVQLAVSKVDGNAKFAVQTEQKGTGHAVNCAASELAAYQGKVIILYGDTPLIRSETIGRLLQASELADITVLGMHHDNPFGYGRLITDDNGTLEAIIEERDCNDEQRHITLCNSGIMVVHARYLFDLLSNLKNDNSAGEYYLTDIVGAARDKGLNSRVVVADAYELSGINTREQLAACEMYMQMTLRKNAMTNGATLIDPASVYLQLDTNIASDVVIHPNVVFGAGVTIESNVEIKSFSHIEGAYIKSGAIVGPFARLRPGSVIGENAHVGNFVELKNSKLGDGAKANHLSYIGDAEVGEKANIGAGTITCNYDGINKYKTNIGAGAFIGSNSSLVAPVTIGAGATVGAGSVITHDVPDGNLGIERSEQVNKVRKK